MNAENCKLIHDLLMPVCTNPMAPATCGLFCLLRASRLPSWKGEKSRWSHPESPRFRPVWTRKCLRMFPLRTARSSERP